MKMKFNVRLGLWPKKEEQTETDTKKKDTLFELLDLQSKKLSRSRSTSTMANYQTAIRALHAYLQKDISMEEMDANQLCGFERWLLERGVRLNTISCYMRSLRSLLAEQDEGLKDLFSKVYTGAARTEKRAITVDAIARLQHLQLPETSFLTLARDVFLFSFYAMGMPFVDVAHLRRSQIKGDRLFYNRHKTGQPVVVVMEPALCKITDCYMQLSDNEFVFPLLHHGDDHEYQMVLGRYNRALRRLEQLAELKSHLTSYVVRHTWASIAYQQNADLSVISKALGHTNPNTTLTYIREIDDQRLVTVNRSILTLVMDSEYK